MTAHVYVLAGVSLVSLALGIALVWRALRSRLSLPLACGALVTAMALAGLVVLGVLLGAPG